MHGRMNVKEIRNTVRIINCYLKCFVFVQLQTKIFNISFSHNKAFFRYTYIVQPIYFVFLGVGSDVALEVHVIVLLYSIRIEFVAQLQNHLGRICEHLIKKQGKNSKCVTSRFRFTANSTRTNLWETFIINVIQNKFY
jgi:hypothetical protein